MAEKTTSTYLSLLYSQEYFSGNGPRSFIRKKYLLKANHSTSQKRIRDQPLFTSSFGSDFAFELNRSRNSIWPNNWRWSDVYFLKSQASGQVLLKYMSRNIYELQKEECLGPNQKRLAGPSFLFPQNVQVELFYSLILVRNSLLAIRLWRNLNLNSITRVPQGIFKG